MQELQITKQDGRYDISTFVRLFSAIRDGTYRVTIKRVTAKNSSPQRGYLFGCVYPLLIPALMDAGWDADDLGLNASTDHLEAFNHFCEAYFGGHLATNRHTGEMLHIPQRVSQMDTIEFATYVDRIRDYAQQNLNLEIPEPDPQWRIKKKK